jgi:hypothetical protein
MTCYKCLWATLPPSWSVIRACFWLWVCDANLKDLKIKEKNLREFSQVRDLHGLHSKAILKILTDQKQMSSYATLMKDRHREYQCIGAMHPWIPWIGANNHWSEWGKTCWSKNYIAMHINGHSNTEGPRIKPGHRLEHHGRKAWNYRHRLEATTLISWPAFQALGAPPAANPGKSEYLSELRHKTTSYQFSFLPFDLTYDESDITACCWWDLWTHLRLHFLQ